MKVLVIGDVIDDVIVVPKGAIRPNTDTASRISQTLGGSAGNIASWASFAGADVTFIGCVNSKDVERVKQQFDHYGVKVQLQKSNNATGTLVSLVEGSSRTMLTDRGANRDLDFSAIDNHHLAEFGFVFLSGYSIFENDVEVVNEFLTRVNSLGIKIMIDPGSAGFIKDYGIANFKNAIKHADILLPNEDEFELLGAASKTTIVKKGSAEVELYQDGALTDSFPVIGVRAIDPTGAGDSFSGTVLAHLANGESLHHAINAGIANAALAVTTIGARPEL
ncbi:MAG: carbohydrate kinase family protein [Rhodoluna sp.]|jgi:sugar/nucleoside kinase (ribokinase family)